MSNQTDVIQKTVGVNLKGAGRIDYPVLFHKDPRDTRFFKEKIKRLKSEQDTKGVLIIYTGGSIGSALRYSGAAFDFLAVKSWLDLKANIPVLHSTDTNALNFPIDTLSFAEPLNSSEIGPLQWVVIATILAEYQDEYEGFVIVHGTDTLVYTASALSFMLNNLSKPVILTGAQVPAINNVRSDAHQNLITSVLIANPKYSNIPVVPEVCIFFRDKLFRGNRTKKISAESYAAFDSPNYPPLGRVGSSIEIDEKLIIKTNDRPFYLNTSLDTNVVTLELFPGIQSSSILWRLLDSTNLKGVILKTYGMGHAPTSTEFLEQIQRATNNGIIIVCVTQCTSGTVEMSSYDVGAQLLDCGVISGLDITAEAALTKLMVLLGSQDFTYSDIKFGMNIALRGEQSHSIYTTVFPSAPSIVVKGAGSRYRLPAGMINVYEVDKIFKILLRFDSATMTSQEGREVGVKIFINLDVDEEPDETGPKFVGCFVEPLCTTPRSITFDLTKAAKNTLICSRISFTIILADDSVFQWKDVELAIYVRE